MANITLKQLRYFEAVARLGHFGRAAESCSVSQPALSVQIRDLEAALGSALIERAPRSLQLTDLGRDVLARAQGILGAVDDLMDHARAVSGTTLKRLKLGVIPTIAPYLLPSVIRALTQRWDGLDIHVRETLTPRLVSELRDGHIDCAILALPVDEPGLTEVPLFAEDFVLIRPEAAQTDPVPEVEALTDQRLLLLEEGHCFRDQALAFCNVGSAAPREGLDGSSLSTLVQMVDAGIGITLIPDMAVPVETRSARVTVSRFEGTPPSRMIGMVWRKSSPMADHFSDVADVVAGCAP